MKAHAFVIGCLGLSCLFVAESPAQEQLMAVPNVQGQRPRMAAQMLRLGELRGQSGVFYIAPANWRDDTDPDIVSMQTPQPRAFVAKGTPVAMWRFAKATINQKTLMTPDVRGLTRKEATARLEKAGLAVMRDALGKETDKVVEHYPRPQQTVYEKTSVYLRTGP